MELTLKQVVEAFEAIKKLSDVPAGNGISIKQAYWLSRLLVEVETEIKRIENLRLEHSDGESRIKPEHVMAFTGEIESLLAETINIPCRGLDLSLENLEKANAPLTAFDLKNMNWVLNHDDN